MKRGILFLLLSGLMLFTACQKINLFGHKKKSLLFRTDIRLGKNYYQMVKLYDSTGVGVVDSVDDDVDCYYMVWNDSKKQEQVMRYNTKTDSNEVYGVVEGLQMILNFSEVYSDSSIYVLSGEGDIVYVFNIPTRSTSVIHMPSMNFIAGLYDENTMVTLKWNNDLMKEEVYFVDNQGNASLIGTIDSLQLIVNGQVSLWDKKVYVLGAGAGSFEEKQIYIYDVDRKQTQIMHIKHADFIAGVYHKNIITLWWDNNAFKEHVYSIAPDGKEKDLGIIDGLQFIVNAAVTLVGNKVFVLGSNGSQTNRVYIFDVD